MVPTADSPAGDVFEHSADSLEWAGDISAWLAQHGGLAIVVDYASQPGKTSFRGIRRHRKAPPLEGLGEIDLSAGVDFKALAQCAETAGARAYGPLAQGLVLRALGIEARHGQLAARANPTQKRELDAALHRLCDPAAMGESFQVLALAGPRDPEPAGFAPH